MAVSTPLTESLLREEPFQKRLILLENQESDCTVGDSVFQHSIRTARIVEVLCQIRGKGYRFAEQAVAAALLHDIGKQPDPEKPVHPVYRAPITYSRETDVSVFQVIESHPARGAEQAKEIARKDLCSANPIFTLPAWGVIIGGILYHHEHQEYAYNVRAENTGAFTKGSLGVGWIISRYLTAPDNFDAMTSGRSYSTQPLELAYEAMNQNLRLGPEQHDFIQTTFQAAERLGYGV